MAGYAFRTFAERKQIENLWGTGASAREIADKLNISISAFYTELRRGRMEPDCQRQFEIARKTQSRTSDAAFLKKLCDDAGLSFKFSTGKLVIFDQTAYEKQPPCLILERGGGRYLNYKLSTSTAGTQYASSRVRYTDPASGRCIEGIARVDDYNEKSESRQQLEVNAKVKDAYLQAGAAFFSRLGALDISADWIHRQCLVMARNNNTPYPDWLELPLRELFAVIRINNQLAKEGRRGYDERGAYHPIHHQRLRRERLP